MVNFWFVMLLSCFCILLAGHGLKEKFICQFVIKIINCISNFYGGNLWYKQQNHHVVGHGIVMCECSSSRGKKKKQIRTPQLEKWQHKKLFLKKWKILWGRAMQGCGYTYVCKLWGVNLSVPRSGFCSSMSALSAKLSPKLPAKLFPLSNARSGSTSVYLQCLLPSGQYREGEAHANAVNREGWHAWMLLVRAARMLVFPTAHGAPKGMWLLRTSGLRDAVKLANNLVQFGFKCAPTHPPFHFHVH